MLRIVACIAGTLHEDGDFFARRDLIEDVVEQAREDLVHRVPWHTDERPAGNRVLELNGATVPRNATNWLRDHQPGESVRLKIRRNGEEKEVKFIFSL